MRAVVQRVRSASVEVEGKTVSSIGPGLLCYIGIGAKDTVDDASYIIRKLLGMRIWPSTDGARPWHLNVQQLPGSILCVSQFTLYGRLNGNKPDHSRAAAPAAARQLYDDFLAALRSQCISERVQDGVFGAMMNVSSVNDGPVTWLLDSEERFKDKANGNSWYEAPDRVTAPSPQTESKRILRCQCQQRVDNTRGIWKEIVVRCAPGSPTSGKSELADVPLAQLRRQ